MKKFKYLNNINYKSLVYFVRKKILVYSTKESLYSFSNILFYYGLYFLSKILTCKFHYINSKFKFKCFLQSEFILVKRLFSNKIFVQYYFFSIIFFVKKFLMFYFSIFNLLKLKKVKVLGLFKFLKLFIFYFFKFLNFFYYLIKKVFVKFKLFCFNGQLFFFISKFRTWVYEDVYKVLERYLFIFVFNKYKKSVQKKPRKMSVLYFYWLEYNLLIYVGVFVFLFYVIYIFQFEIIFYYFPDVFILRLNELMSEPQLCFSGTNSFLSESYITPQLEKRQLNISSLVGGSSYLFFKYRRFVRGIHYMQLYETANPFWTEFPYSPRHWDPKTHRMPGDKTQTYRAMINDEKAVRSMPFPTIWYRVYLTFYTDHQGELGTPYKAPIPHPGVEFGPLAWRFLRTKYKNQKKNNSPMLVSVPLLKIKSTPFFYLHIYNLTEQKNYKQKLLYKKFMSKLSSSDVISKLPYNIDGRNLIRLLAHRQQLVTKNEEKHSFDNSLFHVLTNTEEKSQELVNEDGTFRTWKVISLFDNDVSRITLPALISYVKNFKGFYGIIDKLVSKFNFYERPEGWLQHLHLNNVMYTHLEKYIYNDINHYSYNKWNRVINLLKPRIGSYYSPNQKYIVKPAEIIRDSLYLPYMRKDDVKLSEDFFFTSSDNLELKYSKKLTGWFKRYANRLYETHYNNRVSPYRFMTRMDFEKKGVFFSDDRKYKMFLNYNLHQEPSGINTSKKGFNYRNFPAQGIWEADLYRINANEGRKRFRNTFFIDDEFLIINNFKPPRNYKIKQFYYDNFQAFVNLVMTSKYAVDSPSRESFWKRFFSRYNYKKKDYYLYYGKRLYDFDKYKVDFNKRYGDIVFLLPERLFSFLSAIFYHVKRREVFFLAKSYGKKKKFEQVDVNDYIISKSIKWFVDLFKKINMFFIKIISFGYNFLTILFRSVYHFIYSFFHLSFLLTKFFDFVKKIFSFFGEKIMKLSFMKYLGIDKLLNLINIGVNQEVQLKSFFKLDFFFGFFEKSIFYRIYLNICMYFTSLLNFYCSNIVNFFKNNTKIVLIFSQFRNLKKVLFGKMDDLKISLEFGLNFSVSILYKAIKLFFNLMLPIAKSIFVFFIELITNIVAKIIYMIPGLRKKRALQLKAYVRMMLKGDFVFFFYTLKNYLLGFLPLNLQHFKMKLRVYLEEKNLKRFRYKTLMLKNRKNSYIWTPKRRILTSQIFFWLFVYVFFYIWICHLKIRLYLEELENTETILFCVTPLLLVILGYLYTVVPGAVLDITTFHSLESITYFDGLYSYIFDATTGEIGAG